MSALRSAPPWRAARPSLPALMDSSRVIASDPNGTTGDPNRGAERRPGAGAPVPRRPALPRRWGSWASPFSRARSALAGRGRDDCWLALPVQSQICSWVPGVVEQPGPEPARPGGQPGSQLGGQPGLGGQPSPEASPARRPARPGGQPGLGGQPSPEASPEAGPEASPARRPARPWRPAQPGGQPGLGGQPGPEASPARRPARKRARRPAQPGGQPGLGGQPGPEASPAQAPRKPGAPGAAVTAESFPHRTRLPAGGTPAYGERSQRYSLRMLPGKHPRPRRAPPASQETHSSSGAPDPARGESSRPVRPRVNTPSPAWGRCPPGAAPTARGGAAPAWGRCPPGAAPTARGGAAPAWGRRPPRGAGGTRLGTVPA